MQTQSRFFVQIVETGAEVHTPRANVMEQPPAGPNLTVASFHWVGKAYQLPDYEERRALQIGRACDLAVWLDTPGAPIRYLTVGEFDDVCRAHHNVRRRQGFTTAAWDDLEEKNRDQYRDAMQAALAAVNVQRPVEGETK